MGGHSKGKVIKSQKEYKMAVEEGMFKPVMLEARDLSEAWFLCMGEAYLRGREYVIEKGSFEGLRRKEIPFVVTSIKFPGLRPLVPDVPQGFSPPTSIEYVEQEYLPYLMTSHKEESEQYTYGEDLEPQIPEVIRRYKTEGFNTNQLCMSVGSKDSLSLEHPQCLRLVDTRIQDNALHFVVYFRSWDLWGGFPANLAGLQLVKEYMSHEIGVEDGTLIALSKGLHLYEHCWELAKVVLRR